MAWLLCYEDGHPDGTPPDDYYKAAERLLQLKPDRPHSILKAALAEVQQQRPQHALTLFRRAYKAACGQGDDRRTAQAGFTLVMNTDTWHLMASAGVGVQGGYPRPTDLMVALREADAAHARCRRLLPNLWNAVLDESREHGSAHG